MEKNGKKTLFKKNKQKKKSENTAMFSYKYKLRTYVMLYETFDY